MRLYASLPDGQAQELTRLIENANKLNPISSKDLFYEIKNNSTSSKYFKPISDFFTYLFKAYNQTTLLNNHLLIGNGLDLTENPNIVSLFYEMDPTRDWKDILFKPDQPNPPLSPEQMDALLCLSLTGVSNSNGTFTGYLVELNAALGKLTNQSFSANKLFGLTALIHLNNGTISANIERAIQNMIIDGSDVEAAQIIIDYSNPKFNVKKQNDLLKIASIFHENTTAADLDVYLTYHQKVRILLAHPSESISVIGPVKRGLPIGNYQESNFLGFNTTKKIRHYESTIADNIYILGTPEVDVLNDYTDKFLSSEAMYGGASSDRLNFNFFQVDDYKIFVLYMSGNIGDDYFNLDNLFVRNSARIAIYDSDHRGRIYFDNQAPFSGAIIDGELLSNTKYRARSILENDGTTTLTLTSDSNVMFELLDYWNGQYNILPNANSYRIIGIPDAFNPMSPAFITPQGRIALCPSTGQSSESLFIFNINGDFQFKVLLPPNYSCSTLPLLQAAKDENFYMGSVTIEDSNCFLTYSSIDSRNGTVITSLIDSTNSTNFEDCSASFPQIYMTPTDSSYQEIGMVYAKRESTEYDLYVYTPSQNITWLDFVDPNHGQKSVIAGPTGDGFIVSSLKCNFHNDGVTQKNHVYELTKNVTVFQNYTLANTTINAISALGSDGYALIYTYCNGGNTVETHTKTFTHGKWSNASHVLPFTGTGCFCDAYAPLFPNPFLQQLGHGYTLLQAPYYNIIIDRNNNEVMGFSIANQYMPLTSSRLPNDDSLLVYTDNNIKSHAVILPTSYLASKPEHRIEDNITTTATTNNEYPFKEQNATSVSTPISFETQKSLFDSAQIDPKIKFDAETKAPIFTFYIYKKGEIVGSAELYGQPFLCLGRDGKQNNLLNTTGIFSKHEITSKMTIQEVCDVLPPTLFDRVIMSSQGAIKHGALRGAANVVGYTLRSAGATKLVSDCINQFIYYGGYFSMRFSTYLNEESDYNISTYLNAMYRAALDVGQLSILNASLKILDNLMNKTGDFLNNNNWSKLGNAFKKLNSLTPYSIFALNARQNGFLETTISTASGALTQKLVEHVGMSISK